MSLKSVAKAILPKPVVAWIRARGLIRDMNVARGKSREAVFREIYEKNLWGGEAGELSSGSGSQDDVTAPYIALVRSLIESEGITTIADLGCGDFRVGRQIVSANVTYVGCDVVPSVIEANRSAYSSEHVAFQVLDIVTDPLPDADAAIIRQVFQHLSNAEIGSVLKKLKKYRVVLITDEQVRGDEAQANADIAPFHGTRRVFGQGLKLERAPFNQRLEVLLKHSSGDSSSIGPVTYLRTVLIRNQRI